MTAKKSGRRTRPMVAARRGPSLGMIIAVVVVLLFAGAVGYGVYQSQRHVSTQVVVPANATATGVPIGSPNAPTTVDIYLDFQCPICREYEQQAGATLDALANSGAARVVYHPVAYLDRVSQGYSSRASAASGCAAQAGVFDQFLKLLYANQPPEGGSGLPTGQLIALGQQAGAGPQFAQCVNANTYAPWTAALTDDASKAGVNGTPTVKVNGRDIDNTEEALRAAVPTAR